MSSPWGCVLLISACLLVYQVAGAAAPVETRKEPAGSGVKVAATDVTPFSAVLWAHCPPTTSNSTSEPAPAEAIITVCGLVQAPRRYGNSDPKRRFERSWQYGGWVGPKSGYTLKKVVTGLLPATRYIFQAVCISSDRQAALVSEVGAFTTAPKPGKASVTFILFPSSTGSGKGRREKLTGA